jgi:hypothetical protein
VKLELHAKYFLLNKHPYRDLGFSDSERVKVTSAFCRQQRIENDHDRGGNPTARFLMRRVFLGVSSLGLEPRRGNWPVQQHWPLFGVPSLWSQFAPPYRPATSFSLASQSSAMRDCSRWASSARRQASVAGTVTEILQRVGSACTRLGSSEPPPPGHLVYTWPNC